MTREEREKVINDALFEIGMGLMSLGHGLRDDWLAYGNEQSERIERNVKILADLAKED